MSVVRMLARPMLAAIFVIQGAQALKNPDGLAPVAKPVTDRVLPTLRKVAPAAVADRIPDDPRTLVRVNAVAQVAGGLVLASGRFPRGGALLLAASLVPTTWAGHAFWQETDPEQRAAQRVHFLKNAGLAGGLLLATVDTEGKPGLWWRARHGAKEAKREARRATKSARKEATHAADTVKAKVGKH